MHDLSKKLSIKYTMQFNIHYQHLITEVLEIQNRSSFVFHEANTKSVVIGFDCIIPTLTQYLKPHRDSKIFRNMSLPNSKNNVNEDLAKERLKCNFDIQELTCILDGGKENTMKRKELEDIALNKGVTNDEIPEDCLSPKERYENSIKKSCIYAKLATDALIQSTGLETIGAPALRRTLDAYCKEVSPFLLHVGMFMSTIMGQGTPEQQAYWLPRALTMEIIGTYAQTELGHGTFIRGLETTATYDPEHEQFVLHSPKLSSYKWWAGGLGKTVNHCIVVAQLYTQGVCHGTHIFIVQIREMKTHMPLPGIKVGEIGPKMCFKTADNGFLGFDHYRIPRENMLMKNAQVLKDGTYVKNTRHEKLSYGTMVFVRVTLVNDAAFNLAKASTIAVRYSVVRRQGQPKPDEPELQILDYLTQQHKLFICIATAHALQFTSEWIWRTFNRCQSKLKDGNIDSLPELHALSSCLKAVCTTDSAALVEQCRLACGGHGYMLSSNLTTIYSFVSAARTYEGDYTVLLLQTARFLVKAWEQAEAGQTLTPTLSYINRFSADGQLRWDHSPIGIISAFQTVAAGKIATCVQRIREHTKAGKIYEDAWELTTVQLVAAAEAHCRAVIYHTYWNETIRVAASATPNVKKVLSQLMELYLTYWCLERNGDLLRFSSISENDLLILQNRYEELLALIRPNAVGLVDAFDIRDEILQSTIGAYDGRVYERLMEEALKSPLNQEPVNESFHKYIKPTFQGKL